MTIRPAPRVDFRKLVLELRTAGLSPEDIAARAGVTGTAVRQYQGGQQPKHTTGEAIIELWMEKLGRTRADLPRWDGLAVEA